MNTVTHIWLDERGRVAQIDLAFKTRTIALLVLTNPIFRLPMRCRLHAHQTFSPEQQVIPCIYVWSPWNPVVGPVVAERTILVHGKGLGAGITLDDVAYRLAGQFQVNGESEHPLGHLVDNIKKGAGKESERDSSLREVLLLEAVSPTAAQTILQNPYDFGVPTTPIWLPSKEQCDESNNTGVVVIDYQEWKRNGNRTINYYCVLTQPAYDLYAAGQQGTPTISVLAGISRKVGDEKLNNPGVQAAAAIHRVDGGGSSKKREAARIQLAEDEKTAERHKELLVCLGSMIVAHKEDTEAMSKEIQRTATAIEVLADVLVSTGESQQTAPIGKRYRAPTPPRATEEEPHAGQVPSTAAPIPTGETLPKRKQDPADQVTELEKEEEENPSKKKITRGVLATGEGHGPRGPVTRTEEEAKNYPFNTTTQGPFEDEGRLNMHQVMHAHTLYEDNPMPPLIVATLREALIPEDASKPYTAQALQLLQDPQRFLHTSARW
ncbi:hypothetical protein CYMTET_21553 [Cymbomonas tetramitiformis]|uniref:Uncharacterized protein n=1 Tax=Cymbomonas tetramitiformis TaxID=36881 RepID=A0AAE0G1Y3_9CHLO|nr:hypothetical protein CYMTET_21553 [Cymbomonas tetramitiformis]